MIRTSTGAVPLAIGYTRLRSPRSYALVRNNLYHKWKKTDATSHGHAAISGKGNTIIKAKPIAPCATDNKTMP